MAKRQREEWPPGGALAGGLDAERRGRAGGDRPWDGRTAGPQRWVDGGDEASALTARAAARKAASVSQTGTTSRPRPGDGRLLRWPAASPKQVPRKWGVGANISEARRSSAWGEIPTKHMDGKGERSTEASALSRSRSA